MSAWAIAYILEIKDKIGAVIMLNRKLYINHESRKHASGEDLKKTRKVLNNFPSMLLRYEIISS